MKSAKKGTNATKDHSKIRIFVPMEKVNLQEVSSCHRFYKNFSTFKGQDACQGDSGGPLISPRPNNLKRKNDFHERMELVGVVSFGQKCGTPNPGGYTRTNRFIKWIIDSMTKVTDTAVVCNGFFGNWIG